MLQQSFTVPLQVDTLQHNCVRHCSQSIHLGDRIHTRLSLLQAVADPTGKEDLLAALRKALLLRLAAQLGCNKVAIGTSATRMAVRTVAMSAKGSGFALSGAIHFTDSRSAHALICQLNQQQPVGVSPVQLPACALMHRCQH